MRNSFQKMSTLLLAMLLCGSVTFGGPKFADVVNDDGSITRLVPEVVAPPVQPPVEPPPVIVPPVVVPPVVVPPVVVPPVVVPPVDNQPPYQSKIPSTAKVQSANRDIATFTGINVLGGGFYACNGPLKAGTILYSQSGTWVTETIDGEICKYWRGDAIVKLKDGQQLTGGINVELNGIVVSGGGIGGKDQKNDNASLVLKDGWDLKHCWIEKSTASGIAYFGSNITVGATRSTDNAAGGFCGSGAKSIYEKDCLDARNNYILVWHDNSKFTKSDDVTIDGRRSILNVGTNLWADYRNRRHLYVNCLVRSAKNWPGSEWIDTGQTFFIEWNCSFDGKAQTPQMTIEKCRFVNNDSGLKIGESANVVIRNNVFELGRVGAPNRSLAIILRNNNRMEAGVTKGSLLQNIRIEGNTFDGTMIAGDRGKVTTLIGSGNVSRSGNGIVDVGNTYVNGGKNLIKQ